MAGPLFYALRATQRRLAPIGAIRTPNHTPRAGSVALNGLPASVCDVVRSGATITRANGRGMIVSGEGGGPAPTNRQLWLMVVMTVCVVIYAFWAMTTGDATPWN